MSVRTVPVVATLIALGAATGALAQDDVSSLRGVVLDEEASAPVAGAIVALVPGSPSVVPSGSGEAGPWARGNLVVRTGPDGAYGFSELPPGDYTIRVECLGYRPATVKVELRGPADPMVSVQLAVSPVRLEPVQVGEEAGDLLHLDAGPERSLELGRVPALRLRQRRHLSTDVRVLAHDDLVEAVTLGERDIFAALHRLPGVTGWEDVSRELWVRGAGRGETVALFDGLPLYEPLHGGGELTVLSPDGLGMVFLHPGVRPADLADASAAVVDLRTRPGVGDGKGGVRGLVDVSMSSARAAIDGRTDGGRLGWQLAGRRSYFDLFSEHITQWVSADRYWDLTGRVDLELAGGRRMEASGLWQSNGHDARPVFLSVAAPAWSGGDRGTMVARTTVHMPLGRFSASQTVGVSRYGVRTGELIPFEGDPSRVRVPASDVSLDHVLVRGRLEPRDGGSWRAGYDLVHERADYDGPEPRPRHLWNLDAPPRLVRSAAGTRLGLWGQWRWRPGGPWTFEAGTRVEAGETGGGRSVRVSPNLMARLAVTEHAALFAGAGRYHQYAQALAPRGISPILAPRSLWLLAADSVPALRSDVVTAGGEVWLSGRWLGSVNGYSRRSTGLVLPDPTPGDAAGTPLFVVGKRQAYGVEASLRRVAGRATLSLAYSYGHSRTEAAGLRYPATTDRPHAVDATALVRLGRGLRIGAAFGLASGIPYTRSTVVDGGDGAPDRWDLGQPNGRRTPLYRRLDLLVDWTHQFDGWGIGAYLQVTNVLNDPNVSRYFGTVESCSGGTDGSGSDACDSTGGFDRLNGVGIGGNIGLRVTF
jgi:hypothetical protein